MDNPYVHRARSYPVKLLVDIHAYCNARCTMCPYPKLSRHQTQGTMDWGLYTRIIDEMGRLGREHGFRPLLTYCYMGEPFLADDLSRYTRHAQSWDMDIYLNTNAAAMTPGKIQSLLTAGFQGRFFISFHGITPEVYHRITGLDDRTTLRHIHYLLDHYDPTKICIRGVDDQWPADEREKWEAYFRPLGVNLEYVPPISRCGSVRRLRSRPENRPVRLFGCQLHHPLVEMVILYDGRAVMCCQDMARELIWGDVSQDGIQGVWNSPVRQQAVRQLYNGKLSGPDFLCTRCEQAMTAGQMVRSLIQSGWRRAKGCLSKAGSH